MAHSSGGGGGSIGGGGGHSSYHSSSGSGSGSSSNPRKTSNKYFHNSRCFCYYDQYGNEQYIYADYDMVAADKPRWIMGIIVAVFSLFIFVPTFVSLIKESKPIDSSDVKGPKYNIEDNLGVIEDKDKVEDAMSEFYKLSGVHLEIVTEFPEAWKRADDLESYALDL